ncbi:hypothetical protein [Adlercreutzia faecimuris]|uniref:Uncharacterized protein n=1 Tax=Adlercreutzia faecimuris TaxID=2897341 RepID=A0ABS9WDR4_9ACTN|nr:hypothetical protein [Adlercreutzia sp. JBNU-10]MCI2241003.1 hypothetical protein [Adlercreutzia sp. JBNU-10]
MDETRRPPAPRGRMRMLTDEVLDGFELGQMRCLSCSGYGNCGYKSYFLNPAEGGVASVCMRRRKQLQCRRDGIEYSDDLLAETL